MELRLCGLMLCLVLLHHFSHAYLQGFQWPRPSATRLKPSVASESSHAFVDGAGERFLWPRLAATHQPSAASESTPHRGEADSIHSLLIDNYDSYTYNLFHMLAKSNNREPTVIYNDDFQSNFHLAYSSLPSFDNIVISPGPGSPTVPTDIGMCLDALLDGQVPVLGVCLGHQALALAFGGEVGRAPEPRHGRLSSLSHTGEDLFRDVPQLTKVVRYHSLSVRKCPDELVPTAWADDVIMALQHRHLPLYGVQFHPESICTDAGEKILNNFKRLTTAHYQHSRRRIPLSSSTNSYPTHFFLSPLGGQTTKVKSDASARFSNSNKVHKNKFTSAKPSTATYAGENLSVYIAPVSSVPPINSEHLFNQLYGSHTRTFWLDSSNHQLHGEGSSRFSFMGSVDVDRCCDLESVPHSLTDAHSVEYYGNGSCVLRFGDGQVEAYEGSILNFLDDRLSNTRATLHHTQKLEDGTFQVTSSQKLDTRSTKQITAQAVPFHFLGGYVGYLSYEMRHEISARLRNLDSGSSCSRKELDSRSDTPLATFLHPTRFLVVDHEEQRLYAVFVCREARKNGIQMLQHYVAEIEQAIGQTLEVHTPVNRVQVSLTPSRGKSRYMNDVRSILGNISAGETYEVCLTNKFRGSRSMFPAPLDLYNLLRRSNPAPYSAFIHYEPKVLHPSRTSLHTAHTPSLAICCSSPERFLRLRHGELESKPIKGTIRRHSNPEQDRLLALKLSTCEKSRAENLMIVDLVRNDFGRVCEVGTVTVPKLMDIESYATVHQMVSTVRGKLKPNTGIIDALVACFPGGSMTGAPKLRTMELIDALEREPRGVYSGTIGFLSFTGDADLNIVIRTAHYNSTDVTIGCGGAIVAMSDPLEEYDEMVLKAESVGRAIGANIEPDDLTLSDRDGRSVLASKPMGVLTSDAVDGTEGM